MKTGYRGLMGLSVAVVLTLVAAIQLGAQDKKPMKPAKMVTYQGSVESMDKAKMEIVVKVGSATRPVIYTADTKFMYGHSKDNKPGSADALKAGFYISCAGTPEAGKNALSAKECVYRETK